MSPSAKKTAIPAHFVPPARTARPFGTEEETPEEAPASPFDCEAHTERLLRCEDEKTPAIPAPAIKHAIFPPPFQVPL